jgi:hypothetical protein
MSQDVLDSLKTNYFPGKDEILDLVDDYTLFSYYLNTDVYINQVILSPLRDPAKDQPDSLPSFVIYEGRSGKLKFYDHGKGEKGGDIFDFVQELYGLKNLTQACNKICKDFGLGLIGNSIGELSKKQFLPAERKSKSKFGFKDVIAKKEFTAEGRQFWDQYYITPEILEEYNVKEVSSLVGDLGIKTLTDLAFSYRIGKFFKVYTPGSIEHKFANNFPSNYVEGLYQLVRRNASRELLIITKSTKDVMVLRLLGYEAIAPKGENILITQAIQNDLKSKYKSIKMLFDCDNAGVKGAAKYPFEKLWIPKEEDVKDISDFIKKYGPQEAYELMLQLTHV